MAKLILRNGRNYGDVARYRDLISKPTINTKIVEAESTSASLDIFKYISKEDYEALVVKNPHCVYAVCDEDGFVREYFFNGYQRYELQDYRIVSDLTTEDPTVLFYLNEDTEEYGKGFYVYTSIDEDPEEFEFRKIYEPVVDMKTIYLTPNGNMSTQAGGYILDESETTEKTLINNGTPYEYEVVSDTKIALKFKYNMYRYYTPNTKYKFRLNYSGDVSEKVFFPTGLEGVNNVYKFSPEEFIMYLPADLYTSTDLEDYHLTLTWYEPTDVSLINPLFIKVNPNNFELINGRYHTDSLINAYTSISKVTDYLYQTFYEGCDYQFAENYFNNHPEVYISGTADTFKGNTLVGRDFGKVYDESAEFVVRTPERTGRFATVGVASLIPTLTKEKVESGAYSEEYGIIPFMVNDGINKAGLMATFHTVPCDKGRCTTTSPDIKTNLTLNVNMVVRYIIDNFASATEAVQYIKDNVSIVIPESMQEAGYMPSIAVVDENSFFVIEFIENRNIIRSLNKTQVLGNFYTDGVTYCEDVDPEAFDGLLVITPELYWAASLDPTTINGLTIHSYGLERANKIWPKIKEGITNKAQVREVLDYIDLKNAYTATHEWVSELEHQIGASILSETDIRDEYKWLIDAFLNRSRDPESENYGTLHTSHSAVYDLTLKKLILRVQEEGEDYVFPLIPDSTVIENLVLSPISTEKIETNQNSLLQTIADTVFTEDIICKINYNNNTYLIASDTIHEDYFFNKYFTLSNTLDGTAQILIRIFGIPETDEEGNITGFIVTGARRYDSKPVSFGRVDPGVNSFLPINNFYGYRNMGFVTFSSDSEFKLGTKDGWHGDQTKLEYSTDKETWEEWDGTTPIEAAMQALTLKYEVYVRAEGGTTTYDLENNIPTIFTIIRNGGADVIIRGNLGSLIDYSKLEKEINFGKYAFAWLFSDIVDLFNVSKLILPIETREYEYYKTFAGCKNLKLLPETFPTGIRAHCFDSMFDGCESITTVKELSKTDTIAEGCFEHMFKGCQKLSTTPVLPYTTLFKDCYLGMFEDCVSIRKPMNLPANNLADACYKQMFKGCTSLNAPSNLPGINLKPECYMEMFMNCTTIEWGGTGRYFRVPYNGLGTDNTDAMKDMFVGTTGDLPEITGTPLMHKQYYYLTKDFYFTSPESFSVGAVNWSNASEMKYSFDNITWYTWDKKTDINVPLLEGADVYTVYFRGTGTDTLNGSSFKISSLNKNVEVVGDLGQLISDTVAMNAYGENTFQGLFADCNELSSAGGLLLPNKVAPRGYENLFAGCGNLVTPPVSIDIENMADSCCNRMFLACEKLESIPKLNFTSLAPNCCAAMFANCDSITHVELPDIEVAAEGCYQSMFEGCENLLDCNDLTFTTLAESCCTNMFYGCHSLTAFGDLPATKAEKLCYDSMFKQTGLNTPPAIAFTELAPYCCKEMFSDCKNLTTAVAGLPSLMHNDCFYAMYSGCESLVNIPDMTIESTQSNCCVGMFASCISLTDASKVHLKNPSTEACYMNMFSGCVNLTGLPDIDYTGVTDIGSRAFKGFLQNCSKITKPCDLPTDSSIKLKREAFYGMFQNCINLDFEEQRTFNFDMPGAETGCYMEMFKGCTKLTKYPRVYPGPSGLQAQCFMSMFEDCVNIEDDFTEYQLTTKKLALNCYTRMFKGCIKLTAPMNFGVIFEGLDTNCAYMEEMFANCIGIVWYPIGNRYAVMTGNGTTPINCGLCAKNMFLNNRYATGSNPSVIPTTPLFNQPYFLKPTYGLELRGGSTITNNWSKAVNQELYVSMDDQFDTLYPFPLNTTLTHNSANGGTFYLIGRLNDAIVNGGQPISESVETEVKAAKGIVGDYTSVHGWLGGNSSSIYSVTDRYAYMFAGAKSLQNIDGLVLSSQLNTQNMYFGLFANSGVIKTLGFRDVEVVASGKGGYAYMYAFCDKLTTVEQVSDMPTYLPANLFQGTFMGCTSLTSLSGSTLPFFNLDSNACDGMFMGSGLTSIPLLNRMVFNTGHSGQCRRMFKNCLGLTTVPTDLLPNKTADKCYEQMFMGCTNLVCTPKLTSTTVAAYAYNSMFSHCKSLTSNRLEAVLGETLYAYAYYRMFEYCDGLTKVPISYFRLYTTFASTYAYSYMFSHCNKINFTKGDIINIQKYDRECFNHTFEFCTSITVLPTFKGEITANCFNYMFYNCTGLVFGFNGDEWKLTSSLTTLDVGLMFKGTSYITENFKVETPQINKTYYIYDESKCITFTNVEHKQNKIYMDISGWIGSYFCGYEYIYRIDNGPIQVFERSSEMGVPLTLEATNTIKLYSCTANGKPLIVSVLNSKGKGDKYKVSGSIDAWGLGKYARPCIEFCDMHNGSGSGTVSNLCLVDSSELICVLDNTREEYDGSFLATAHMFHGCVNLKYTPKEIVFNLYKRDKTICDININQMFRGCVKLAEGPKIIINKKSSGFDVALDAGATYFECSGLTYVPDFPQVNRASFVETFQSCTNLVSAPAMYVTGAQYYSYSLEHHCFINAFNGCTSLRSKPKINFDAQTFEKYMPGTTKKIYHKMFYNCVNIKEPYINFKYPAFDVKITDDGPYAYMYYGTGITWSSSGNQFWIYPPTSSKVNDPTYYCKKMVGNTKTDGTVQIPDSGSGTPKLRTTYHYIPEKPSQYVTLSAPSSFTVKVSTNYQYSTDGAHWEYGNNNTVSSVGNKLYLAGQIPASNSELMMYKNTENGTNDTLVISGGNNQVKITGTLQALTGNSLNASYLFKNTTIYDASGLVFPTTLPANACKEMFGGCTKLVATPNLSSLSSVGSYACSGMFSGCTALTTITGSKVGGTGTLGAGSFKEMFMNCTNLTGTGYVPDTTTMPNYACERMYAGCTKLTSGAFPVNTQCTFGSYSMHETFKNCTSLVSIASYLPNTVTLNDYAFSGMFANTGIVNATSFTVKLPASSSVKKYVYESMFANCKNLETPATIDESLLSLNNYTGCFKSMYEGCVELTSLPTRLEKITTLAAECYKAMFKGCVKIDMPCTLPALKLLDSCYMEMFSGCTGITWVPAGLSWRIPEVGTGTETGANTRNLMFYGTTGVGGVAVPITPYLNTEYYLKIVPEENDWLTIKSIVPGEPIGYLNFSRCTNETTDLPMIMYSKDKVDWEVFSLKGSSQYLNITDSDVVYLANPIEKYKNTRVDIYLGTSYGSDNHGLKISGKVDSVVYGTKYTLSGEVYNQSICFADLNGYAHGFDDFTELIPNKNSDRLFSACYNLVDKIPNSIKDVIPSDYSCAAMFNGCKKLTTVPKVVKPKNCRRMFKGCESLVTVPTDLLQPENNADVINYSNMFEECYKLKTPPVLPITNPGYKDNTCSGMYNYCEGIKWSVTGTPYKVKGSQSSMFANNTGVHVFVDETPNGGAEEISTYYYNGDYKYCIVTADKPFKVEIDVLSGRFAYSYDGEEWQIGSFATSKPVGGVETLYMCRIARNIYDNWSRYVIYSDYEDANIAIRGKLSYINGVYIGDSPELKAYTAERLFSYERYSASSFASQLRDASLLELDFADLDTTKEDQLRVLRSRFNKMFQNNASLKKIPNSFKTMDFANKLVSFYDTFESCTALENVDINWASFTGGPNEFTLENTFKNCTSLKNIPTFPTATIFNPLLRGTWENCTSLTKAHDMKMYMTHETVGTVWLDHADCSGMYKGCTGIIKPGKVDAVDTTSASGYNNVWNESYMDSGIKFVNYPTTEIWRINAPGVPSGYVDIYSKMFKNCENDPGTIYFNNDYYFWEPPTEWVTFSAPAPFTITLANNEYLYSKDKTNWVKSTGTTITSNDSNELYVITNGQLPTNGNGTSIQITGGNNRVKVAGRADYLNNNLGYIFKDCTALYDISEFVFPATHEAETSPYSINDYPYMFEGCTNLTYGPNGAIYLNGYNNQIYAEAMFRNCKNLTGTIKVIIQPDATKIGGDDNDNSLISMFEGCEKLESVVFTGITENTILTEQNNIFKGCESLTSVTGLDFKKLVKCESMFEGCEALTGVPTKNLCDIESCKRMFFGCKALTFDDTPSLSFTSIKGDYACKEMFMGCTSITEVPEDLLADIDLFKNKTQQQNVITGVFTSMFEGCTSLTKPPKLLLEETCNYRDMIESEQPPRYEWSLPELYKYMFKDCTSLVEHPELHLKAATPSICEGMFKGCTSLEFPMDFDIYFFQHWDTAYYYADEFGGSSKDAVKEMYMGCTNIKWYTTGKPYTVPINGTDQNLDMSVYAADMFVGTTSVEGGEIPRTPVFGTAYFLYPTADEAVKFTGAKSFGIRIDNHFVYKIDDEETWHRGSGYEDAKRIVVNPGSTLYMYGYTAGLPKTEESKPMIVFDIPMPSDTYIEDRATIDPQIKISGKLFSLTGPGYNAYRMFAVRQESTVISTYDYAIIGCYDVRELEFPDSTTKSCFKGMFEGDTYAMLHFRDHLSTQFLTYGPTALPAKKVAAYGYCDMFARCDRMITCMDELPADRTPIPINTRYEELHYRALFQECQMDYCYSGMFRGCKSLTQAPAFHLTPGVYDSLTYNRVAYYTYSSMFEGCTSLVNPPVVIDNGSYTRQPVDTLLNTGDMYGMFRGCTSLRKTLYFECWAIYHTYTSREHYPCREMYAGCTNLVFDGTGVYNYIQRCSHDCCENWSMKIFEDCGGTPPTDVQINTNYKYSYDL